MTKRIWMLTVALLVSAGPVVATSIRPVNLLEMLRLADRVFVGTVIEVRHRPGPGEIPTRVARFRVTEVIKGELGKSKEVSLTQVWTGSNRQRGVRPLSAPGFLAGEEVLVFLHGDSALGLSSPVGFGLGKLSVERVAGRRLVRLSPEQRAVLFRGLKQEADRAFAFGEPAGGPATVPLETLLAWLKRQMGR